MISLIGTVFLLINGCARVHPQPEPVRYYTLSYDPPDFPECLTNGNHKPVTIHLKRLDASAPYDTNQIIYAESPYERSSYAYHRWISTPATMVGSLLLRDIEKTGIAEAVVTIPAGKTVTHRIEGTIIDFYENDAPEDWEAVLALRLMLIRSDRTARTEELLFKKTYREIRILKKNNPLELARAMSKALETVSKAFIEDICRELP